MSTVEIARANQEKYFERLQRIYDASKTVTNADEFITRCDKIEDHKDRFEEYTEKVLNFDLVAINTLELQPEKIKTEKQAVIKTFQEKSKSYDEMYTSVAITLQRCKKAIQMAVEKKSVEYNVKLPKISLQTFGGKLSDWPSFFENFNTLIHKNPKLDNVAKFHYLNSALYGPPRSLIKHLPITNQNYEIVWKNLTSQYQNSRILSSTLLDSIFNCPGLKDQSSESFSRFLTTFNDSIESLKTLKLENLSDVILLHVGLRKLPNDLRKLFENEQDGTDAPALRHLIEFLKKQMRISEMSSTSQSSSISKPFKPKSPIERYDRFKNYISNEESSNRRSCPLCSESHALYQCDKFKNSDVQERIDTAKTLKCCLNCLARGHIQKECQSKFSCSVCQSKHHSLLCYKQRKNFSAIEIHEPENESGEEEKEQRKALTAQHKGNAGRNQTFTVILGTAVIKLKDGRGKYQSVRAVIDPGAMSTFMTQECAKRLSLPVTPERHVITGLSDQKVKSIGSTNCQIKPKYEENPELSIRSVILPCITDFLPCSVVPSSIKQAWSHLDLADPNFEVPSKVDLLLGAELVPFIYTGPKKITDNCGSALKSIFGWVIIGKILTSSAPKPQKSLMCLADRSLNDLMTKFWKVEEPITQKVEDPDDKISEEIFKNEHYRDSTGRYVVPLLLKSEEPVLSDTYNLAMKRLHSLERKLQRSPELREAYNQFLDEYESLGHMEEVKEKGKAKYYIPHQIVVREASISTKYRVVFDASMASNINGISLNSILYTGPKLQADIVDIILRFRTHRVALTADICKMFRQILIKPQDRRYQHILWRKNENEPVKEYELRTVTYGTSSAPFLSGRTVKQLNSDEGKNHPRAAQILDKDIFVDDALTGGDSISEAIKTRDSLIQIGKKGGFEFKKWSSSHSKVLEGLKTDDIALSPEYVEFDQDNPASMGVLGLRWSPSNDTFSYNEVQLDSKVTKRSILSNIARIFDPVGWITPVVLSAKIIIQKLWIAGLNWDDTVPIDLAQNWDLIKEQLHLLNTIKIPRLICNPDHKAVILIGFSDASTVGYGATIYLRTESETGFQSNLMIAKSKVAPTNVLTVPRLELCGAQLLAKIMKVALNSLSSTNYIVTKTVALTDSVTVLSWLTTPPFKLKTYVANRVVDILDQITADQWMHVSTHDNPADIASRGILPKELVNNKMWWFGPSWLQQQITEWKISSIHAIQKVDPPELKTDKVKNLVTEESNFQLIEKFSSFKKLQRVTAWCLRFMKNARKKLKGEKMHQGPLSADELDNAVNSLIKIAQNQTFLKDLNNLKENKKLSSYLAALNPFVDTLGVLRVGGRLRNSELEYTEKYPAILPKNHDLTYLIIDYYHERHFHAGPRLLQSIISQHVWIISARRIIRSRLSKCVRCFRVAPRNHAPKMGDLPPCRVTPSRCFLKVGTDFGGPVFIKEGTRKNARIKKAYICLFVCMASKALHLELVSDLSTEAFIAALDRMIARRGVCDEIFSDCGTNYVGAKRYLNELQEYLSTPEIKIKVQHLLTEKKIKWNLNPPSAPHFGGLWEAGIKSVKYHLKRAIGDQRLNFEEYATVLAKIEAILNSRPLCALSSDIEDIRALTPAHLLIGAPLLSLPEYDWNQVPQNRLSRWQLVQKISQSFWQRWSREYLNSLQQRQRWLENSEELKIGDVVVVKDDNTPPLHWKLAKIAALHRGNDKVARVASISMSNKKITQRPVIKLFRLPIERDEPVRD